MAIRPEWMKAGKRKSKGMDKVILKGATIESIASFGGEAHQFNFGCYTGNIEGGLNPSCGRVDIVITPTKPEGWEYEWQELDFNNLPTDILVIDYQAEVNYGGKWSKVGSLKETVAALIREELDHPVRYRKPRPAPSHETIMDNDWKVDGGVVRVVAYNEESSRYGVLVPRGNHFDQESVSALYFADKEPVDG